MTEPISDADLARVLEHGTPDCKHNWTVTSACPLCLRGRIVQLVEAVAAYRARLDAAERLSEERRVLLAATLERECVIERECDALTDVLQRHGFVRCDIPACNCGSWHPRYGLTERMGEIKDALHEAGHELCNANGNLTLNALRELIAERDALREALRKFCIKRTSAVIDPPHGLVLCLLCKTISRELDPRRELGHERDEQHAPGCLAAPEKEPNP